MSTEPTQTEAARPLEEFSVGWEFDSGTNWFDVRAEELIDYSTAEQALSYMESRAKEWARDSIEIALLNRSTAERWAIKVIEANKARRAAEEAEERRLDDAEAAAAKGGR